MKSVLLGRKHGSEEWTLIAGPDISTSDQIHIRAKIMESHPVNEVWQEVIMWNENVAKGRLRFITKAESESAAAAQKKADAELESARAEAENRQAKFDKAKADIAADQHAKEVERLNKLHAATVAAQEPINKANIAKRAAGQAK